MLIKILTVFFGSMLPVIESTGMIPYALAVLKMPPMLAFIVALSGNCFMVLILLHFLEPVTNFLRKHSPLADRLLGRLFERTQQKHSKAIAELGHFMLFLYLALPTPGSGAWTGSLIAHVFGLNKKTAFLLISAGVLCGATLLTFGTLGIVEIFF